MAIQVYNEGRVVGLSSYESYVRRFLSDNPTGTPASETEWLASSLAMGASLVLNVPANATSNHPGVIPGGTAGNPGVVDITPSSSSDSIVEIHIDPTYSDDFWSRVIFTKQGGSLINFSAAGILTDSSPAIEQLNLWILSGETIEIHNENGIDISAGNIVVVYSSDLPDYSTIDISLPVGTNLRAANTVYGAYTDIELDNNTKVAVYSNQLIPNDSTTHPAAGYVQASNLPTNLTGYAGPTQQEITKLLNYAKIQEGVVLQSGTWSATSATPPTNDLSPDLSASPILRLLVRGAITTPFNILLTGFTDAGILSGTASISGSTATQHPENGDFLGPATFPWASKVVFVVDTNIMNSVVSGGLPKILSLLSEDLSLSENGNYTFAQEKSVATGKPYIVINGVRLYVATAEPQPQLVHVSGVQAPTFVSNKYYRYDEQEEEYFVLETVPADWQTNYADYFYYDDIPDGSIGIGWTNS